MANLLTLALVKLAALVVAASSGFRGGRIFPAVFVGVALGMLAHQLVDSVPISLAITSAVLGILLATTRQGWLSLLMAATTVMDLSLLPVLCIAALPACLPGCWSPGARKCSSACPRAPPTNKKMQLNSPNAIFDHARSTELHE